MMLILCICVTAESTGVDLSHQDLTSVPQDIYKFVTVLLLEFNSIESVDNNSFVKYESVLMIGLQHNPLKVIGEDTFAKNRQLGTLHMVGCQLKSLPQSFGLAAVKRLRYFVMWSSIKDPAILRGPYFGDFTSLIVLLLPKTDLFSLVNLTIPPTIREINVGQTRLTSFPNVTASRLPRLSTLKIYGNSITDISTASFEGISDDLQTIYFHDNGLLWVPDLSSKPKLETIKLHGNNLETVPDLLTPNLKELTLADNPIICDRRMCWWKMWHRLKSKPAITDDVICTNPPKLTGSVLAEVNPRDMHCYKGNERSPCNWSNYDSRGC